MPFNDRWVNSQESLLPSNLNFLASRFRVVNVNAADFRSAYAGKSR